MTHTEELNLIAPYLHPPYTVRNGYNQAVRRAFLKAGYTPIRAQYNPAGDCLTCGECGRCPGYHAAQGTG